MSIYRARHSEISMKGVRNSINEILPNKAPDHIERTKFEQSQTASIVKAINNVENPVKEKHVRNIILGTFHDKNPNLFWQTLNYKIQLRSNPIICWKFCYTFHKLLRDGHPNVVAESLRFCVELESLAKLWVHLRQDYGEMIHHYCILLSYKLNFHKKNLTIPGNLVLADKDLHLITNNDINNYFQLCCEFFDYIDEILKLQQSIFSSMDRNRSNSMTESGQCKLAPLIMCIQESINLYDFSVKFLFKLYDQLSSELLEGHRVRFIKQFKGLKDFYETCKNLQYFKNLITIPDLPNNPPNFRVSNDFQAYSKPVVVVPEPEETSLDDESTNELLVDLSGNDSNLFPPVAESPFAHDNFQNYQNYINEIQSLKDEIDRLKVEHEFEVRGLRERIKTIERELLICKSELEQQKIKNQYLEEQMKINSENEKAKEDLELLEKKAVSSEEKLNKMKDLYVKLRDEHVNLLKQDAEVKKQLLSFKETYNHANVVQKDLEKRLDSVNEEKDKIERELKAKLEELLEIKSKNEKQTAELLNSNIKLDTDLNEFREIKSKLENKIKEANSSIEKLSQNEKDFQMQIKEMEKNSNNLKHELNIIKEDNRNLVLKLNELKNEKLLSEKEYLNDKFKTRDLIIHSTFEQSKNLIKESINKFDDPILLNCKSGAEYLLALLNPISNSLNKMKNTHEIFDKNPENDNNLIDYLNSVCSFASNIAESMITGKITSLTAADIEKGIELADLCHNAGELSIDLLSKMKTKDNIEIKNCSNNLETKINDIIVIVNELLPKIHDIDKKEIGDLVEQEMHNTTQAIEEAVAKLESLMNKSRSKETGVKLEVNDKILDSCTELMKAIKMLIIKAKELQKEIAAQGRGTSTVKEFYAKNHKWTEGLVSAAKLVGLGANVLIEKADKLVNGNGKLEEIIVASNEISASTAQLVVSSNVKANRESPNRRALIDARNIVSNATANLVASAKSCSQIIDDQTTLDFSNLSLHQSKRLEMEAQIKVLELEKQLETEKRKLYKIRKQHYHLAGENEGFESKQNSINKN